MSIQTADLTITRRRETALLSLVSAAHFISHVHIMVLPALIPLLPGYFGVSFLTIGMALTVFNLVSLFVQTPMGFITDRIGAWRMLIFALVLGGASFALLAATSSYAWLIVAMVAAGIANGVYHPADYALLSSSIEGERLGKAFSIHTFAGFLGTAVTPAILLGTAGHFGVGPAFALAGIASLAVAIAILGARGVRHETHQKARAAATAPGDNRNIITPTVLLLTVLFVLLNLSASGIQAFSVTALTRGYGIDLSFANAALTGFLLASAFGVLAGGILADRTHRHGALATGAMIAAAALTAVLAWIMPGNAMLMAAMIAIGFLSGIITPSRDLLVRAASPRGAEGRVFGVVSTGFNIGGAISPLIFGWLIDNGYNQGIFAFTALFMLLTGVVTILPVFGRK
jgi:MFS family permease